MSDYPEHLHAPAQRSTLIPTLKTHARRAQVHNTHIHTRDVQKHTQHRQTHASTYSLAQNSILEAANTTLHTWPNSHSNTPGVNTPAASSSAHASCRPASSASRSPSLTSGTLHTRNKPYDTSFQRHRAPSPSPSPSPSPRHDKSTPRHYKTTPRHY